MSQSDLVPDLDFLKIWEMHQKAAADFDASIIQSEPRLTPFSLSLSLFFATERGIDIWQTHLSLALSFFSPDFWCDAREFPQGIEKWEYAKDHKFCLRSTATSLIAYIIQNCKRPWPLYNFNFKSQQEHLQLHLNSVLKWIYSLAKRF